MSIHKLMAKAEESGIKKGREASFTIGDTVEVHVKITEGDKERIQIFSGIVISKKGASINAVLYVAKKGHVQALLGGTSSEDGRIGYVALTRARDLFVLAVPENCLKEFENDLKAIGLQRSG